MKVYWVYSSSWGQCFFTPTREESQRQCDFRMKEKDDPLFPSMFAPEEKWWVEEEDIPDEEFGYCINGLPWQPAPAFTLPYKSDCSVGMVRKLRNGLTEEEDDGTCGTCPYFRKEKPEI